MFQRILVANRGEIALRIIRACKDLGVEVVAVYSQADRDAPYLELADQAICIGKASGADSYLNIPRLIAAAEVADVQAIHPGYGFLSENPHFAEICRSCNFEFIGPPHEAIRRMGLKTEAKLVAAAAKVACVPGSDGPVTSNAEATRLAAHHRLPRPDQGRGRRRRPGDARLLARTRASSRPSRPPATRPRPPSRTPASISRNTSTGPGTSRSRSWPTPTATSSIAGTATARSSAAIRSSSRNRPPRRSRPRSAPELGDAAVRLAKAVGYVNAGTCEFLVDADNNFYFIEVNARIQVEHPVTELVTGIDLVKQQIRIAAGERLGFSQIEIVTRGHAIECRINAEDPDHDFRPSPGTITALRVPGGPGVRWDSHVAGRLPRPPPLRLAGRQADRPRPQPSRGPRDHATRPR